MSSSADAIAIVGMAGRFPGARDLGELWQLLCSGRDALTEFSEAELLAAGIESRSLRQRGYVRAGMVLDDIEGFDADFFGISAHEARIMDPQQRLLLECAWHALEDAGQAASRGARIAVYAGARLSEYMLFHQTAPDLFGHVEPIPLEGFQRLLGNDKDYLATRIAHLLDLRGPAITLQTACSTSLVAVHMACQSLLNGECDLALAGGASLRVPQKAGYVFSEGMIFSPDGRTRPFDAKASGTIFGSGAGFIVLRRLDDAVLDDDEIYAVIRGSAVNNDGSDAKAAFTAPSVRGQARVIEEALAVAQVDAATVSYIEAHGTGTAVGDPVEVAALSEVFRRAGAATQNCAIGAVKGNVGHLLQAAGVCGLMKVALMMRHRTLVPAANFTEANPLIDFRSSPFFVNTELAAWTPTGPLRAGVSAFGFGGTNAHVVLEEAPARESLPREAGRPCILPISARSSGSLRELVSATANGLEEGRSLRDVCHSAQRGRAPMPHRVAVVASTAGEMRTRLARVPTDSGPVTAPRIAFLFTGQGVQLAGMGRGLYETQPVFRASVDASEELLRPRLTAPLRDLLFSCTDSEVLTRTDVAQPLIVALQIALVEWWRSVGVEPDVVAGHSLGELTAAWAAGSLSTRDVLQFAAERGRLMHATQPGAMLGVSAEPADIGALLHAGVSVAARNAPGRITLSGSREAIQAAMTWCAERGMATTIVNDRYAFHSALMEPVLGHLASASDACRWAAPTIRFVSTLTGDSLGAATAWSSYWTRQAREPVRFADAMRVVAREADLFIEIGPDAVLTALGRALVSDPDRVWVTSMRRGRPEQEHLFTSLAEVYSRGVDVRWEGTAAGRAHRVALPLYPFQRRRYWIERRALGPTSAPIQPDVACHPLLGARMPSPLPDAQFTAQLSAGLAPFTRDHWLYGLRPLVMVGHLEMMRAAAAAVIEGDGAVVLEDVLIEKPVLLADEPLRAQTVVGEDHDGRRSVRIFTSAGASEEWTRHSSGEAYCTEAAAAPLDLESIRARCPHGVTGAAIREQKKRDGADLGPAYDAPRHAWVGDGEALIDVRLTEEEMTDLSRYGAHPGVFDAIAQCANLTLPRGTTHEQLYLPTVVERVVFHRDVPASAYAYVKRRGDATEEVYGIDAAICDEDGAVFLEVEGLYFKRATRDSLERGRAREDFTLEVKWVALDRAAPLACEGDWLVLADETPFAAAFAREIEAAGGRCVVDRDAEALLRRVRQVACAHFVDLACGRTHDPNSMDRSLATLLKVAQTLTGEERPPRLWIVTRGAQGSGKETALLDPFQAARWGFARTLQREHPGLVCRLVDLDPSHPPDARETLDAFAHAQEEPEVVLRGGAVSAMRLRRRRTLTHLPESWILDAGRSRTIDALRPVSWARRPPGRGEVEIEVFASGLNFRDVLNASGRIDGPLGYECSGIVVRCGEGVADLQPGTEVMALAPHSFASHVIADARFVIPKPRNLGFAAAAGSVVAFLSAHYALVERAQLRPGARVLVHAAAGGVGQAAMQIAGAAGATVYATASDGKRDLVRDLGAERVWDSRSTGFARLLIECTQGRGVDVVLNTLGDEFLDDNLAVLRRGGVLVDLGHPSVVDVETASSRTARAGCTWVNFHIAADVARHEPESLRRALLDIGHRLETGALRPLPHRAFAVSDCRSAFESMMRGAHTGKIVLTHGALRGASLPIHPDGTYLVTGGTGALGLQFAEWLVSHGARSIALTSRRAPSRGANDAMLRLEAQGAVVRWFEADLGNEVSVAQTLDRVAVAMSAVRGVIHAAGTIDDGVVSQQTPERLAAVLAPKLRGAWLLHRLLAGTPLDFFVLVSSAAGVWGNPGQTTYGAANAFLDQLAHYRRQLGLPALSIDFGAWRGDGMASNLTDAQRRRRSAQGSEDLSPDVALRALSDGLREDLTQMVVANVDWETFARSLPPELARRFADVVPAPRREKPRPSAAGGPPQTLAEMTRRVAVHAAEVAGISGDIDGDATLPELGLDSLSVLLLRGRLIASVGEAAALPVVRFLERRSVAQLAEMIFHRVAAPQRLSIRTVPRRSRATNWRYLTLLREGGSLPPLLLVPPAARTAMAMQHLVAKLEPERPVYGFNPAGLDGGLDPHRTTHAMAADYIAEMRSAFPPPYFLGGFCMGAHVAWEMAVQLRAAEEDVPLLILFDSRLPEPVVEIASIGAYLKRQYNLLVHHLRHRSLRRAAGNRVGRVMRRAGSALRVPALEMAAATDRVFDAHVAAAGRYTVPEYGGNVLILESAELSRERQGIRWSSLVRGKAELVTFAGIEHVDLLGPRYAETVAREASLRLNASRPDQRA